MRSSLSARLSTQKSTSRAHNRSQVVRVATYNSVQSPRLLPTGPLNDGPCKRVLPLLSELVEIQVSEVVDSFLRHSVQKALVVARKLTFHFLFPLLAGSHYCL
jgi:hypothetical protein